jgi:hypothetical protein
MLFYAKGFIFIPVLGVKKGSSLPQEPPYDKTETVSFFFYSFKFLLSN